MKYEGFYEDDELPVKRGDVVTILKGVHIRTMLPRSEDKEKIAGRTYRITVNHVLCGTNRPVGHPDHNPSYDVKNPSVRWPGKGGYWFEVDVNDLPEVKHGIGSVGKAPEKIHRG